MTHRLRQFTFLIVLSNVFAFDDYIKSDIEARENVASSVTWTEEPQCPLWGPMDTFYTEAIVKQRVRFL